MDGVADIWDITNIDNEILNMSTQDKNTKNLLKFVRSYNAKKYGVEADEPCNSCATSGYRCFFGPYSKACSGCIFRSMSCHGESSRPKSLGKTQSLPEDIRDEARVQVVVDHTDCFPIFADTGMPDYNSGPSKKPTLEDLPPSLQDKVKAITKDASVAGPKFTPLNSSPSADPSFFKGKIPILGTTVAKLKAAEAATDASGSTKKKSTVSKSTGYCRKSTRARDNVPAAQKNTQKAKLQQESDSDDDDDENENSSRRGRSRSVNSNSDTEGGDGNDSESSSVKSSSSSNSSSDNNDNSNFEEVTVSAPVTPTTPVNKESSKPTPTRSQHRTFIRSKSVAPNNASGGNYESDTEIVSLKRQLKQANDGKAAVEEKLTKAEKRVVDYKGKYRGMKRKYEAIQEEVSELKRKRAAAIEAMYEGEDFDFIYEENE